jgi:hypothetical protein
MGVVIS